MCTLFAIKRMGDWGNDQALPTQLSFLVSILIFSKQGTPMAELLNPSGTKNQPTKIPLFLFVYRDKNLNEILVANNYLDLYPSESLSISIHLLNYH